MILGTGVDVVDLAGLADQLRLPGSAWVDSVLTARERRHVARRLEAAGAAAGDVGALARHVGALWAAKEAVVKAWSTALTASPPPLAEEDLDLREIEVVHDHWGRPGIAVHGRVEEEVSRLAGPGGVLWWHVSLSHDGGTALAMVVLESRDA